MKQREKVVVVGGGMAGLTAAAYLARDGYDVEVFEQHYRLGGCCTSFKRRQFVFDAAIHAVGGCHEGGILRKTYEDLGIWDRVEMVRADPMDIVMSPTYNVPIFVDRARFEDALRDNFPHEIDRIIPLLDFLYNFGPADFGKWGTATYRDVLNHFLQDDVVKTVFTMPLGNIGMSSRRASAMAACTLWRENQLNGGYAPKGSFQHLADVMGQRIEEFGGRVHKRHEVSKIHVDSSGQITGVDTRSMLRGFGEDRHIPCRYVVGAGAPHHLFYDLIGKEHLPESYSNQLDSSEMSFSGAVVFFGFNKNIHDILPHHGCHWYLDDPSIDSVDAHFEEGGIEPTMFDEKGAIYLALPSGYDSTLAPEGKSIGVVILPAIWKSKEYWAENKERMGDVAVSRMAQIVPGGIEDMIEVRNVATSATIERFTRNTKGSWYGWAMTPEQSNLKRMDRTGPVGGMYLAGHWTRPGPGLLNVIKSGELTAKAMIRQLKRSSRAKAA